MLRALYEAGEALVGHVIELRQAFLGKDDELSSLSSRLAGVARAEEEDDLSREAKALKRKLEQLTLTARSEREGEQQEISKISHLIRESLVDLRQSDGRLAGDAEQQLTRLDAIVDEQSGVSPRVALAVATRHLKHAISLHARERAAQDRKMKALAESLREEVSQARDQASRDALTGLLNRGAFETELQRGLRAVTAGLAELGFILIDIDHFKKVNDTYGHPAGDEVLKHVANMLVRTCLRRDDIVARYGGEEFAIVLRDIGPDDLLNTAERLRRQIAKAPITLKDEAIVVTVSLGVDVIKDDDDRDTLLQRVDAALYEAKGRGRNCVAVGSAAQGGDSTSHLEPQSP